MKKKKTKKRLSSKWLLVLVGLVICVSVLCFLFFKFQHPKQSPSAHLAARCSYFVPVKIIGFDSAIPCVETWINNHLERVEIDLGWSGELSLSAKCLQEIENKSFIGRGESYGWRGKKYEYDIYEIPEVDVGGMTFFKAKAKESSLEFEQDAILIDSSEPPLFNDLGKIGWETFYNVNFFLDCKRELLAFCDGLETLKDQGYCVEDFVAVPFVLDRELLEFEAMTADGPIRCVIDTGCTKNFLNKDLKGGSNEHMVLSPETIKTMNFNPENTDQMKFDPGAVYETATFTIGQEEFGPVKFLQIKTPLQIDAFLGMEFLSSRPLFIDFLHRKLYFSKKVEAPAFQFDKTSAN